MKENKTKKICVCVNIFKLKERMKKKMEKIKIIYNLKKKAFHFRRLLFLITIQLE